DDTAVATVDGAGAGDRVAGPPRDTTQDTIPAGPGGTGQQRTDGEPVADGTRTGGGSSVDPPAGIAISAERVVDVLFQQLDRFPPMADAPPSARALGAII